LAVAWRDTRPTAGVRTYYGHLSIVNQSADASGTAPTTPLKELTPLTSLIQLLTRSDQRPVLTSHADCDLRPVLTSLADCDLRPVLTSLAVLAFVAAPAFKIVVHTAGGNWN
jgi:hypothetical protein